MPILPSAALALALAVTAAPSGGGPAPSGGEPAPSGDVAGALVEGEAPAPLARRYAVERIALVGLRRTREATVRQRLVVREGDVLDDEAVLLSRLRLVQLGWFRRVETRVERGSARGLVVLVFVLEERNTLLVSDLFIGSTDPQPLYGGLGVAEHNWLGRGLELSGAFVYGGTPAQVPLAPPRLSLRGALVAPDLAVAGTRAHAGASALFLRGEELTCGSPECEAFDDGFGRAPRLRYSRRGGAVEAGTRTNPVARAVLGARFERIHATHLPSGLAADPGGPPPAVKLGSSSLVALSVATRSSRAAARASARSSPSARRRSAATTSTAATSSRARRISRRGATTGSGSSARSGPCRATRRSSSASTPPTGRTSRWARRSAAPST
jgi:hypothetical protein